MSYTFTLAPGALETELKRLILQETDKLDDFAPEAIGAAEPLFGDSCSVAARMAIFMRCGWRAQRRLSRAH